MSKKYRLDKTFGTVIGGQRIWYAGHVFDAAINKAEIELIARYGGQLSAVPDVATEPEQEPAKLEDKPRTKKSAKPAEQEPAVDIEPQ